MIFESTVLWDEKELFSECGRAEQGYMGYAKYILSESGFGLQVNTFRDYTVEIQAYVQKGKESVVGLDFHCYGYYHDDALYRDMFCGGR